MYFYVATLKKQTLNHCLKRINFSNNQGAKMGRVACKPSRTTPLGSRPRHFKKFAIFTQNGGKGSMLFNHIQIAPLQASWKQIPTSINDI